MPQTYINGRNPSPEMRKKALASYVHRYTKEHVPEWATHPRPDGIHEKKPTR